MRICFASLFYSEDDADAGGAPLLRALPAAMAARGHEVTVLHLADHADHNSLDGVDHRFLSATPAVQHAAALASAVTRRPRPLFEWPRRLSVTLRELRADVVHVHGTQLHVGLAALRRSLPAAAKLVIHYHGGAPTSRPLFRNLQRRNLRRADAVLFTTAQQAAEFAGAAMLRGPGTARLLIETSSDFKPMNRSEARRQTGMDGSPVYLSAARLHPVKDPLTLLRGFQRILSEQPEAMLYLYYLSDELLPEMQRFVEARPELDEAVHFRGRASRSEMEAVFNSADILLQASVREFSGCALLDAMACGVVPVMSDIPPFRTIAGDLGGFFPPGDADALAREACRIDINGCAAAVFQHFERELSYDAMARKLEAIYNAL